MAVKIRLQRKGRKKAPFYFIVVADARSPRDGRFIEKLGTYNPLTIPATIDINRDRAYEWLSMGAQPTDTVNAILRFKGVLYQKHLQRGVKKGALTPEQAEAKLAEWVAAKEAGIEKRRDQHLEKKRQAHASVDGTPKARAVKAEPVAEEPLAAAEESAAEAAEEAVAETEAPVETPEAEAPAAEEKTEE